MADDQQNPGSLSLKPRLLWFQHTSRADSWACRGLLAGPSWEGGVVCLGGSLNRALWLWAVNPFTCLCILLVVPRMIKMMSWNVLGDLVVKNPPYKAGTQVWSLVREIRSHMPRSNQIRMTQLVKHECHNYRVSALQQTAQRASAKTGRNKINKRMIKKKATMKNLLAVKSRPIRLPMFA